MVAGCSNITSERQEDNGIEIEQQATRENLSTQSTDITKENETPVITNNITDYSEHIELDEKDGILTDDSDLIERINKYMIPEQSFDVTLDDWGEVTFMSCKPVSQQYEDTSFFLVRDDQILYKFPDSTKGDVGLFDSVGAVAFRDINDDGKDDIVIIINYITGAGPQGMIPRPVARIFLAGENEFYIAEDMETDVAKNIVDEDMTIETIYNYLKDNN